MYLTISCTNPSCRAVYRAYRIINPPRSPTYNATLISYCMFCGDPTHVPSTTQDMEFDADEVLARRYDRTLDEIKDLINVYHNLPTSLSHITFESLARKK